MTRRHLIVSLITGPIAFVGVFWILRSDLRASPLIALCSICAIVFVYRLLEALLGVMAIDRTLRTVQILRALPVGLYSVSAFLAARPTTLRYAPWVFLVGVLLHFGVSWPYIRKLRKEASRQTDWGRPMAQGSLWSPFQSPEVREICAHLAPEEHERVLGDASRWGRQLGKWIAIPIGFVGASFIWSWQVGSALLVVFTVYLAALGLPRMRAMHRRTKELLCETAWARSQGYSPERLRLTTFPWSSGS